MDLVHIRVYLAGSHSHAWRCPADHPSVRIVMNALSANGLPEFGQHEGGNLVRLVVPHEDGTGERALVFLRQALVAVETEPPLVDELPTVHSARQAWLARRGKTSGAVTRPGHVVLPGFLPQQARDELFDWLLAHEQDFLASSVRSSAAAASDDYDFRTSRVSMNLGPWRKVFEDRLATVLPEICEHLGIEVPDNPRLELQLTQHGHLDHFKAHTDNATGDLRQRRVSLVYYLHRQPRPFQGGELVLYDRVDHDDGTRRQGEGFRVIQPEDNHLVAFDSGFHHQVRTVRCPDGDFGDGRITVNGWLRDLDRA